MDRGLAYGDGVFETIRLQPQAVLLAEHLDRLQLGLEKLDFRIDCDALIDQVRAQLFAYQQGYQPELVKIIITRGIGGRGYAPPVESQPRIILSGYQLPAYPVHYGEEGIDLFLCKTRLSINPALAGIKHLNRLEQVLASAEFAQSDYAEGLMADVQGDFIEGTRSNLFLVVEGCLQFPAVERCAVAGLMQAHLLRLAQQLDIDTQVIQHIDADYLLAADEVFVCNTVMGICPVRAIMGQALSQVPASNPNSLTNRLKQQLMPLFSNPHK